MDSVKAYVWQMGQLLDAAAATFPHGGAVPAATLAGQWPQATPPPGDGALAAAVAQAAAGYETSGATASELVDAINRVAAEMIAQAQQAGAAAAGICDTARAKGGAITPATGESAGVGLLVTTMDERLGAMQKLMTDTREVMAAGGERIGRLSADLVAVQASRTTG